MQNPVENLEPGTRLVFTVKDQSTEVVPSGRRAVAGGGGVRELGWGMIHVNKNTMNSQVRKMEGRGAEKCPRGLGPGGRGCFGKGRWRGDGSRYRELNGKVQPRGLKGVGLRLGDCGGR